MSILVVIYGGKGGGGVVGAAGQQLRPVVVTAALTDHDIHKCVVMESSLFIEIFLHSYKPNQIFRIYRFVGPS